MKVFVMSFVLLLATGLVPAKELSRMPVPTAAAAVGPVSSLETGPHILAIRDRQDEALARGDVTRGPGLPVAAADTSWGSSVQRILDLRFRID